MPDAARVGHTYHCKKHKAEGVIEDTTINGSPDVEINSQRAARVTDRVHCAGSKARDRIIKGSATVEINGLPASRKSDATKQDGEIDQGSDNVEIGGPSVRATPAQIAAQILHNPNITLARTHVAGHADDGATAYDNVKDVSEGKQAKRSSYKDPSTGNTGKGGSTDVNVDTLETINDLGKDQQISVSEIAGGVHGDESLHYSGNAADINEIDNKLVLSRGADSTVTELRQNALDNGASYTLGPGDDAAHKNHVHAQFPKGGGP
jgi:uncharacterized Zn-binding protein involved in type VI secretion